MKFKGIVISSCLLLSMAGCNMSVKKNELNMQEDQVLGKLSKTGQYLTEPNEDIDTITLPDVTIKKFGQQVLTNQFNINGVYVNSQGGKEVFEKSHDTHDPDGATMYNHFAVADDRGVISEYILYAPKKLSINALHQNWDSEYRTTFLGDNGQRGDIYDTVPDDNFHVEVDSYGGEVYTIKLLRGEVAKENLRTQLDLLLPEQKQQFETSDSTSIEGIANGMSRQELFDKFGTPDGDTIIDGTSSITYGDTIVHMDFGSVSGIGINGNKLSLNDFQQVWGNPERTIKKSEIQDKKLIYPTKKKDMKIVVTVDDKKVTEVRKYMDWEMIINNIEEPKSKSKNK